MLSHQNTIDKLDEFSTYGNGWHFGEGVAFDKSILAKALELVTEAATVGFIHTDAFPGANGEIAVTIYDYPHYLAFCIEKNGLVTFVRERFSEEDDYLENVPFGEAKAKIGDFGREWHEKQE